MTIDLAVLTVFQQFALLLIAAALGLVANRLGQPLILAYIRTCCCGRSTTPPTKRRACSWSKVGAWTT